MNCMNIKTNNITNAVPSWTTVDGPTLGTDGPLVLQDNDATNARAFYLIKVSLP